MTEMTCADGLRELADWADAHPDLADRLPTTLYLFAYSREDFQQAAKELGGRRVKNVLGDYFNVERAFGPFTLQVTVARHLVCEKKVTQREVTALVRDPALVEHVPLIEVTETVEDVEWECAPSILAEVNA